MSTYLVVHTRYTDVQLGLFRAQNSSAIPLALTLRLRSGVNGLCLARRSSKSEDGSKWASGKKILKLPELLASVTRESKLVTKCFIADVTELLQQHNLNLSDLNFICAHQGPAPFTTLRVSLTLLNGLSFARKIPLIGVDGLHVFTHEFTNPECSYTIALLNAFCNDIYYGIYTYQTGAFHHGYAPAERFLSETSQILKDKIYFIGNGVALHEQLVKNYFGERAVIASPLPQIASLETIAADGLKKWEENSIREYQVIPLYLKSAEPYLAKAT